MVDFLPQFNMILMEVVVDPALIRLKMQRHFEHEAQVDEKENDVECDESEEEGFNDAHPPQIPLVLLFFDHLYLGGKGVADCLWRSI
mmetsp:Transcript_16951/g.22817  ORF Transcript_16951/g.22817 Transcript_16951/m.22817 type:complete len:87 (-) Transcript_16951:143-403(-)